MLITFKSEADSDVIMFGEVGQHMLEVLGKNAGDLHGIVTVEQLPQALTALQAAVETDKAGQMQNAELNNSYADGDSSWPRPDPVISFSQRAVPLLSMLQHARRAGVPVIWVGSGKR